MNTKTAQAKTATTKAQAKPTEPQACRCGCKLQTIRPEALYLPGHDARHAGRVGRALIANPNDTSQLDQLPTDALKAKARGMVAKVEQQAAEKARRQAARDAAKAAYAAALAAN